MTQPVQEPTDPRVVSGIDYRTRQLARRPPLSTPGVAVHEIKVFEDVNLVAAGDDAFIWEVPEDLDGATIVRVDGFISNPGTGTTQVAIRLSDEPCNPGVDILTDKITIESGDCNAKDSPSPPVVIDDAVVAWGNGLHIDVDSAAANAFGLGVHIIYTPSGIGSIGVEGVQGPPGGVTQYQGQWMSGTTYNAGDIVTNNNTVYVTTVTYTADPSTEPGVGVDWETVLAPLFETAIYSGLDVVMHGGGFQLDTGIKAYVPVPFDCDIIEATLLADQSGSVVVDIWNDDYGSYPPTNADSITSATPPTLSAAIKTTDTTLSGWTTSLTAGDVLAVVIESVSQINFLTLGLRLRRNP